MCGILAVFGRTGDVEKNRREVRTHFLLRERETDCFFYLIDVLLANRTETIHWKEMYFIIIG